MEHPLIHLSAATKAAAKRCRASATLLEVRDRSGRLIDVNVMRLSDRRVMFRARIALVDLCNDPEAVAEFVTRSIYAEYQRLEAGAILSAWCYSYG